VTNRLPMTEPVTQQFQPPAAAVDADADKPPVSDQSHARGGHGIFGEPMVS